MEEQAQGNPQEEEPPEHNHDLAFRCGPTCPAYTPDELEEQAPQHAEVPEVQPAIQQQQQQQQEVHQLQQQQWPYSADFLR